MLAEISYQNILVLVTTYPLYIFQIQTFILQKHWFYFMNQIHCFYRMVIASDRHGRSIDNLLYITKEGKWWINYQLKWYIIQLHLQTQQPPYPWRWLMPILFTKIYKKSLSLKVRIKYKQLKYNIINNSCNNMN